VTFDHIVGAATALAALGAVYFAWRTVREARAAATEARRDHRARRLEEIITTVAQIKFDNGNMIYVNVEIGKDRLRAMLPSVVDPLPLTRKIPETEFSPAAWPDTGKLCDDALTELREAVVSTGA
jgi:hypothetical protein